MKPITKRTMNLVDSFSGRLVQFNGYSYEGDPGLYDSYLSAVAAQSGCWEEYCEYHRLKRPMGGTSAKRKASK
ncbi:MAG: hypothetical protein NVS1B10_05810 [Candidatus Saccharimonadales bacterium]